MTHYDNFGKRYSRNINKSFYKCLLEVGIIIKLFQKFQNNIVTELELLLKKKIIDKDENQIVYIKYKIRIYLFI